MKTIEINLDLPANQRWDFAKDYSSEINELIACYWKDCEEYVELINTYIEHYKIMFVPDAILTHFQGACSQSRPVMVEWHKHKGMVRFYRKFFRHQYPGVLMWTVIIAIWIRFGTFATYSFFKRVLGL